MVIDSSALVAILLGETEAELFSELISNDVTDWFLRYLFWRHLSSSTVATELLALAS